MVNIYLTTPESHFYMSNVSNIHKISLTLIIVALNDVRVPLSTVEGSKYTPLSVNQSIKVATFFSISDIKLNVNKRNTV